MTEQERIEVIVKMAGSGRKLAERIGTTSGSISKLRSGRFHLESFAVRIATAFPELNCRWLLTGEGEPSWAEVAESEVSRKLDEVLALLKK